MKTEIFWKFWNFEIFWNFLTKKKKYFRILKFYMKFLNFFLKFLNFF